MGTHFSTKKRRADQVLWSELDKYLLPRIRDGVVLAISGGPDSRALLEAVSTWPKRVLGSFVVACIDHGARTEARAETLYVHKRALRLGFSSHHEAILNLSQSANENELRTARYEALRKIAARFSCATICTAHHRDDDNEGFLMALMGVGGGALGASMNELELVDGIWLCRPFLALQKSDLLVSLSLAGITDFVRDRLDEARVGERAYVRHEVFPELFKRAPEIANRLQTFGRVQREQAFVVDKVAQSLITWNLDSALIDISQQPKTALVVAALWRTLKTLNAGKDLRASQKTIDKIVADRDSCTEAKCFEFPGLTVTRKAKSIEIKRT